MARGLPRIGLPGGVPLAVKWFLRSMVFSFGLFNGWGVLTLVRFASHASGAKRGLCERIHI